jgi:hypothetical protein
LRPVRNLKGLRTFLFSFSEGKSFTSIQSVLDLLQPFAGRIGTFSCELVHAASDQTLGSHSDSQFRHQSHYFFQIPQAPPCFDRGRLTYSRIN